MKSKKKSWLVLIVVVLMIAACGYVSAYGYGKDHIGTAKNIKLGLDLAGGVNITYEADEDNPSSEDMNDTVYKLQQRVEAWSTEAEVYQEGTNRVNVDIPGVYDAEKILSELGNPGSISFCEAKSDAATGKEVLDGYCEVVGGEGIKSAQATSQKDSYGNTQYVVSLMFTDDGAKAFAEATARNIGKPIYIIYDGKIISYPTVNQAITNGQCVIEGNFTYDDVNSLATTIRAGVLKYWIPGVAAALALLLYVAAMLCFLNGLDVTLTLPGIAGIILSVGMAVDANVIIFTRIREEIAAGKNVREAIKIGFGKALSAVIDGNITTLIAAAVLYLKGTGTIKGFAITLALGIVLSMFTALVITRFVLMALYGIGFKDAKFYGKQKEAKVKNFCGMKKITYVIAVICICAGFVSMGVHASAGNKALNYSLDFTGGTAMTVNFKDYLEVPGSDEDDLRKLFESEAGTTDIQFQNVSGSPEIVIKTPVLDPEHRAAVKDALMEKYALEQSDITEENISGTISGEMRTNAILSVLIAGIFIMIYIWVRFRDIKFGAGAIIALLHDVLVVLAVYSIARIPVGTTFIACMLTIVGYSINATIVVYDRIRENSHTMVKATTEEIVNTSISQTLSRSINTSLTTLIMVLLIYIMGVTSIKEFALPMMAGIIAGTFSSVFISGTIWAVMKGKKK